MPTIGSSFQETTQSFSADGSWVGRRVKKVRLFKHLDHRKPTQAPNAISLESTS